MKSRESQEWFKREERIAQTHPDAGVRAYARTALAYEQIELKNILIPPYKLLGEDRTIKRNLLSLLDFGALITSGMIVFAGFPIMARSLIEAIACTVPYLVYFVGSKAIEKINEEGLTIRRPNSFYSYWEKFYEEENRNETKAKI